MLRAIGSTGRRNGAASLSFLSVRKVPWVKRNWALLRVDCCGGEVVVVGGADDAVGVDVPLGCTFSAAGGGVGDLRRERECNISTPAMAHKEHDTYVCHGRFVGIGVLAGALGWMCQGVGTIGTVILCVGDHRGRGGRDVW